MEEGEEAQVDLPRPWGEGLRRGDLGQHERRRTVPGREVGEAQGSEFLKVEADGEDLQEIKAEVVERGPVWVKTVGGLKTRGGGGLAARRRPGALPPRPNPSLVGVSRPRPQSDEDS